MGKNGTFVTRAVTAKIWERAVEEALSPVLKRLSNKIMTGGLSKVTAITRADCETMRAAFGRCSALLHSEAAGLNTPLPAPDVVAAEIIGLDEWVRSVREASTSNRSGFETSAPL